jgi:hypothetical protein
MEPLQDREQDQAGTREQLRSLLWEACEIEQQLMVQYLFAAFTMKKRPDERCSPAQLESVRRWGSQVFMVARQEMEHLALANGMLTAIAEDPFFARENIPVQPRYYLGKELAARRNGPLASKKKVVPCDLPFIFRRFDLDTIGRFVCAESPGYETLEAAGIPIPSWCFGTKDHPCRSTSLADWRDGVEGKGGKPRLAANKAAGMPLARTHLPAAPPPFQQSAKAGAALDLTRPIHPGTIQELYDEIRNLLRANPGFFVGNPTQQVFVPVEYQINIFPITDFNSADLAIKLIVEEGEGIDAPPGFQSHYDRFLKVRQELLRLRAEDKDFDPALPVIDNPSRDAIQEELTRKVFDLFNYSYATMLCVLTSLYRNFSSQESSYPFFSTALQNVAFGPFMTMILRPIADVLVHMRVEKRGKKTAGPDFHLSPEDERLIWPGRAASVQQPGEIEPGEQVTLSPQLDNIDFFLDRFSEILARLEDISADRRIVHLARSEDDILWVRRQLAFVTESAQAMANNMRRIYQVGEIPQFIVQP